MSVLMLLTFPLQCHPCRAAITKVIQQFQPPISTPPADDRTRFVTAAGVNQDDKFAEEITATTTTFSLRHERLLFILITSAILLFAFLIAFFVSNLTTVSADWERPVSSTSR